MEWYYGRQWHRLPWANNEVFAVVDGALYAICGTYPLSDWERLFPVTDEVLITSGGVRAKGLMFGENDVQ